MCFMGEITDLCRIGVALDVVALEVLFFKSCMLLFCWNSTKWNSISPSLGALRCVTKTLVTHHKVTQTLLFPICFQTPPLLPFTLSTKYYHDHCIEERIQFTSTKGFILSCYFESQWHQFLFLVLNMT